MQVNDLPVGRSVDEVLRLLQAFQFVEKHGEGELGALYPFRSSRSRFVPKKTPSHEIRRAFEIIASALAKMGSNEGIS